MSAPRSISGLEWARLAAKPPHRAPRGLKGAKARGLAFEKQLLEALGPKAQGGVWFEFCDRNGRGFCQPDIMLKLGHQTVLILEVKYTWTPEGHQQLENLYRPVVREVLGHQWLLHTVQVCKLLSPDTPRHCVHTQLVDAIAASTCGRLAVLHWPCTALAPLSLSSVSTHLDLRPVAA